MICKGNQYYKAALTPSSLYDIPAPNTVIRGTSTNVGGTETFNIQFIQDGAQSPDAAETITVNVDANGNWEYGYTRKKIYSLKQFALQNSTLTSIRFTERLSEVVDCNMAFAWCENLSSIDLANATFDKLVDASLMFAACQSLTSLELSKVTFSNVENAEAMFAQCDALTSLNLSNATFENVTNAERMFFNCYYMTTLDISSATFENVEEATGMFYNDWALTTLYMMSATFENVTVTAQMFNELRSIVDIYLPRNSTAISAEPIEFYTKIDLQESTALSYASMLNLAQWVRDMTSEIKTRSMIFNTTAWNALSQTQQNTIINTLQAKKWDYSVTDPEQEE